MVNGLFLINLSIVIRVFIHPLLTIALSHHNGSSLLNRVEKGNKTTNVHLT